MTAELLIGLALALFVFGIVMFRWADSHGPRVTLKKYEPNEQDIHAAVHRLRSFSQPAAKGFRPGFTKDDADVERLHRRHLDNVVRLGDRRVQ